MTLEQLRIFVAVAQREHMTRAAEALHLTQPAVSAAVAALETQHGIRLFDRIGRGIELTEPGRALFVEARAILEKVASTNLMLAEFGCLERGTLTIAASQTIGAYWLPPVLQRFRALHPAIALRLEIGNSEWVADRLIDGDADLGFVEGDVEKPALSRWTVTDDQMLLVQASPAPVKIDAAWILSTRWVLREKGSGTRSTFEAALAALGVDPAALDIALVLPSNEAVRTAVEGGAGAAVLSRLVVSAALAAGSLSVLPLAMPRRHFAGLRHNGRYQSKAARAFAAMLG